MTVFARRTVVVAASLLVAASHPGQAMASCVGPANQPVPVVFIGKLVSDEGRGTAGQLYRFDVEVFERGTESDPALVDISVDRKYRESDGSVGFETSSLSLGPAPVIGGRYRVAAYVGDPGGKKRLFANGCGGGLRALDAAPTPRPSATPMPRPTERPTPDQPLQAVAIFLALIAGSVLTALVINERRRGSNKSQLAGP